MKCLKTLNSMHIVTTIIVGKSYSLNFSNIITRDDFVNLSHPELSEKVIIICLLLRFDILVKLKI
jgi:hypothetical protein